MIGECDFVILYLNMY